MKSAGFSMGGSGEPALLVFAGPVVLLIASPWFLRPGITNGPFARNDSV